ncbi:hypothetical protein HU200_042791 [Digitaria exilis]|uniref:Uncharacterized protein n=1 Tax=Digitaria exilis TaxID=1010633 RepID=A0A835BCL0_9POAL|nr:hypothetical protein HU200_042791 [Digitaria exilis]
MNSAALAPAPAVFSSASVRPRRGAAPAIVSSASGRPRRGARGAVRCEVVSSSAPSAAAPQAAKWAQRTVVLSPQRRGCHLITSKVPACPRTGAPRPPSLFLVVYHPSQIVNEIRDDLAEFKCGMAHLFVCIYSYWMHSILFMRAYSSCVWKNFILFIDGKYMVS